MNNFAKSMRKIAQEGLVARPTPAQIYAARKADRQYQEELRQASPAGYAKAVAGAITVPLITPVLFTIPTVNKNSIQKHINTVYVAEAIKKRFPEFGDDANGVAAAIVNSSYDNPITRDAAARIVKMKFDIADQIANKGAPGVDKERGKRIVADADAEIKKLLPPSAAGLKPKERFEMFDFKLQQAALQGSQATYQSMLQDKVIFMPDLVPGFNSDYAMALTEMGKHFYKRRTGKELTSNAAAIKLISRAAGNSMKAGVPLSLIAGAIALNRQNKATRLAREVRQEGRAASAQDPAAIWGPRV